MNLRGTFGEFRTRLWSLLLGFALTLPAQAEAADLADVVVRIRPSIVAVGTYERTRNPRFAFRGTGFAIGDGLLIATNAHVLQVNLDTERLETFAVILPGAGPEDSRRREARVAVVDGDHDLALLRISGPPLPPLAFAGTGEAREGLDAAFTGFPIGSVLGLVPVTHRATVGAMTPIALPSARAHQLDDRLVRRLGGDVFEVLQLDATAYPGNSGSPLYNARTGDVLGVVNMVFVKSTKESALSQPSGISFAVPVRHLRDLAAMLKD